MMSSEETTRAAVPTGAGPTSKDLVRAVVPDLDARIERYDVGGYALDEELMEVFYEQMEIHVAAMKEAQAASDHDAVESSAHSIKGMGGTMGVPEISVLGEVLEMAAKEQNAEAYPALISTFVDWNKQFNPKDEQETSS